MRVHKTLYNLTILLAIVFGAKKVQSTLSSFNVEPEQVAQGETNIKARGDRPLIRKFLKNFS